MISKTASDPDVYRKEIIFTNSAREGWELVLKTLSPASKVLLPSYIGITEREGSGIYDPVSKLNLLHDFYLLNYDLSITLEEIERCLSKNKYDLILLVHYFGFKIKNIEEIVSLCKKYNVIVVEDCAHLYNYNLLDISDVGSFGDFVFYSLHKNFPLKNGGLLVQNNMKLKSPTNNEIQLEHNFIFQLHQYDAKLIALKRLENYRILDDEIKNIEGVSRLKSLAQNDVPHTYPIIVGNDLREKLYFWLAEKHMTVIALYYRLIDPLNNEYYNEMQNISNSILNLPIHQDISKNDINILIEGIKQFYGQS